MQDEGQNQPRIGLEAVIATGSFLLSTYMVNGGPAP